MAKGIIGEIRGGCLVPLGDYAALARALNMSQAFVTTAPGTVRRGSLRGRAGLFASSCDCLLPPPRHLQDLQWQQQAARRVSGKQLRERWRLLLDRLTAEAKAKQQRLGVPLHGSLAAPGPWWT